MTNDSKLGMVAGVAGVIVAAVLLSNSPPPAQSKPGPGPSAKDKVAAQPAAAVAAPPAAVTPATPPQAGTAALASTPVARTRKDVQAQPTSLSGAGEEP
jgi:hypothetical protein